MDADLHPDADGWLGDEALLAWLRRVATEADPVPDAVVHASREAIATLDIDGELAVLLADSHAQDDAQMDQRFEPVRSHFAAQRPRLLTFAGGGVQIDLELDPRDGLVDVTGQLTGAGQGECEIQHATAGLHRTEVDGLGRFIYPGLPRGPVRLRCRSTRHTPVTTAWVTI